MSTQITFTEIPISSVVYNHDTGLFPFSPRREIDPGLVERLKRSIAETGVWRPIVVRKETMEGIAGNHRFLACLKSAEEKGWGPLSVTIPAVLIDYDEGLAVSIALIENELRENLTQWEMVRTLLMQPSENQKWSNRSSRSMVKRSSNCSFGKMNSTMRPSRESVARHCKLA